MRTPKASPWIAGTGVVVVLLLAGAWFLLVSPVLTSAGETNATADQVESENVLLRERITVLKEQFANIETYRAELASLRTAVPTDDDVADYLRQLDGLAVAHSVTLTTVSPSTPTTFVPAAAVPTEPVAVPAEETADDTAGDVATDPATAAPVSIAPAGMVAVPLGLTAVGTYDNVRAFLDALQTGTPRLLLVESVVGAGLPDAEAGGGRPATAIGDLEVSVSGYLFVLPATTLAAPVDEPTEQPALPVPPEGRNPLVPLG